MALAARSIGDALVTIAGRESVRDDASSLDSSIIDGARPRFLVRPASIDELSRVIALAHDAGLAAVPRGNGRALELGNPPAKVDLVVDLTGLDRVIEHNPDDLTITVQAGMSCGALAALLAPHRQSLAIDPPGLATRTLGGVTATNALGPLRARFGGLRDLLLGVRFVQPDGVVTWGGSKVVKSVSGYDVPKLMVGALGTLGVLAELTLRLHPLPDLERSWLVCLDQPQAAQELVSRLVDSSVQPGRVELLNDDAARFVLGESGSAGIAVSMGSVADAVNEQGERLAEMAKAQGARVLALPDDFWSRVSDAMSPPAGWTVLQITSLPGRLADTLEAVGGIVQAEAPGAEVRLGGCATLGTLRLLIGGATVAELDAVITRVRAWVGEIGGGVVVASGPADLRRTVDPWGPIGPGALALMRALRDEFDPRRVLNPGRYVRGI